MKEAAVDKEEASLGPPITGWGEGEGLPLPAGVGGGERRYRGGRG